MAPSVRKREVGRGERVLPGVFRLRLPLPFPGVPHCNAWAVASGHGVVLFDCGMHEHATRAARDPEAVLQQRIEIARSAGVPPEPLAEWSRARREGPSGIAAP